uniref:Uncharacterized protein n=1 Tax=Pseudomonas graminis TaxID=158627 RepID=A0A7C2AWZ7_9PSED
MSVRRGPTEQDRSEGTLTKEGPNQEQAPLVTWGAFPSNSPKAKPEAVRPTRSHRIQILAHKQLCAADLPPPHQICDNPRPAFR